MTSSRIIPATAVVCPVIGIFISSPSSAFLDPTAARVRSEVLPSSLVAASAGLPFLSKQVGAFFLGWWRRSCRRADV